MSDHLSPLFTWRTAVTRSNLPSSPKHVALALSLFMAEDGDSCHPGLETLAQRTSLSKSTICAAINTLIWEGWLKRERGGKLKGGRGYTSRYLAVTPETVQLPDSSKLSDERTVLAPKLSGGRTGSTKTKSKTKNLTSRAKRAEGKSTTSQPSPGLSPKGLSEDSAAPSVNGRKRNLPFDALVEVCPGVHPKVDGGRVAKALKDIRARLVDEDIEVGDDTWLAEEIRHRAELYLARWSEAELTPTALAKHWTRVWVPRATGKRCFFEKSSRAEDSISSIRQRCQCPECERAIAQRQTPEFRRLAERNKTEYLLL